MSNINLMQQVRIKKKETILAYLRRAFKDFAYPVYLFGSYATERFHGHSDVDILIVLPEVLAGSCYRAACDKLSGLGEAYEILVVPALSGLDPGIRDTLQPLNGPGMRGIMKGKQQFHAVAGEQSQRIRTPASPAVARVSAA
ncbi:MAG: nucleotidyltransferase domain-containing protein [Methylococcaceae bacterium]|nr:MAG: nucleotidyltransferase domain-containing protein [Methylococcaceae bacterium]